MTKLINRLNMKSVAFESVGVDVVKDVISTTDVISAISFSKISKVGYELIRFKHCNEATEDRINAVIASLILNLPQIFINLDHKDQCACARVAIIEFCKVPYSYKPSIRNRAVFAGCSKTYFHEHGLDTVVNAIARELKYHYAISVEDIEDQLETLKSTPNYFKNRY